MGAVGAAGTHRSHRSPPLPTWARPKRYLSPHLDPPSWARDPPSVRTHVATVGPHRAHLSHRHTHLFPPFPTRNKKSPKNTSLPTSPTRWAGIPSSVVGLTWAQWAHLWRKRPPPTRRRRRRRGRDVRRRQPAPTSPRSVFNRIQPSLHMLVYAYAAILFVQAHDALHLFLIGLVPSLWVLAADEQCGNARDTRRFPSAQGPKRRKKVPVAPVICICRAVRFLRGVRIFTFWTSHV